MPPNEKSLKIDFSCTYLGPILYAACHRLWLLQLAMKGETTLALFASRGGLRLLDLYHRFLVRQRLEPPVKCLPFMISRLSVAKAAWRRAAGIVGPNILREFRHDHVETLALALVPEQVDKDIKEKIACLPKNIRSKNLDILVLHQLINTPSEYSKSLNRHIFEQEMFFNSYINALTDERLFTRLLLCDTGLFGSTQIMLMAGWPEYEWYGHYIGRSNYRREPAPHFAYATGLILEKDRFLTKYPETALLKHWHLIEMPMEPDLPSVTHYYYQCGFVRSNLEITGWQNAVTNLNNPYYQGIVQYFEEDDRPIPVQSIYAHRREALLDLQKKICAPKFEDILLLTMSDRCQNFGRNRQFPVLYDETNKSLLEKIHAIKLALWREGQIQREFPFFGNFFNQTFFIIQHLTRR